MSFQVCHMEKLKRTDVRGILEHLTHRKDSSKNGDIDKTRTKYNLDLVAGKYMPSDNQRAGFWRKTTDRRLSDFVEHNRTTKKALRKDATFVCSFVLGSDHEKMVSMPEEERKAFFTDCYNFFCSRYGKENVLFAVVHNDELTPQLHLGVIPLTKDGRLSAKTLFDKMRLQQLQTDLAKEVGLKYGLERGVVGSKRKHLDELNYKFTEMSELNEYQKGVVKQYDRAIKTRENMLKNLDHNLLKALDNEKAEYVFARLSEKFPKSTKQFENEYFNLQKEIVDKENELKARERELENRKNNNYRDDQDDGPTL